MAPRFEGLVALVTGAASGIGRATAQRLGAEGARVLCADVDRAGVETTAETIRQAGGEAAMAVCDVSDADAVGAVVAGVVSRWGKLDVLCSVAGVGGFRHTHEETLENWNRTIGVNLTGAFLLARAALPHLVAARGAIVFCASVAGLKSHPYSAAYCASKGGVVLLTKALAVEYARKGVRVNCVCPGGVDTPFLKNFQLPEGGSQAALMRIMPLLDRMARPAEVAAAIAFLASEEASYVNGTTLVVDAGMTA